MLTIGYSASATATISAKKQNRKLFYPHPVFASWQVSQRSCSFFLCALRLLWKEPNSWDWKSKQIKGIIGQKRPEEQTWRQWLVTGLSSPGSKNIQNRDPVYSLHTATELVGLSTCSLCMCVSKHTIPSKACMSASKTRALFPNHSAMSASDLSCLTSGFFLILQIM